eukprot:TRINITY_DN12423_c0_g1_i16.p1 TRINITY_DN12423_c0_g1~~TRINITY_DN12423_c0_g1_i16.p1  ORF type:complete len:795 (+),score=278.07 TRINITY_DN12423_c0_g1_i16:97-2481(+)
MATELNMEDFARMQESLMTMKTEKFEAEDRASRAEAQLQTCQSDLQAAEKSLAKATKSISKSKKAKEVQAMMDRYEQQLAELGEQRDGLMKNLTEMSAENEKLGKQLKGRTSASASTKAAKQLQSKLEAALADKARMQASLDGKQQELERLQEQLRQQLTVVKSDQQSDKQDSDDRDASSLQELLKTHVADNDARQAITAMISSTSNDKADELARANTTLSQLLEETRTKLDETTRELSESQTRLSQLETTVPPSPGVDSHDLQDQIDKLEKKVQRKQAALLDLQKSQAELADEHTKAIEDLIAKHDDAQSQLENEHASILALLKEENTSTQASMQSKIDALEQQVSTQQTELEQLKSDADAFSQGRDAEVTAAQTKVTELTAALDSMTQSRDELDNKLQAATARVKAVEKEMEALQEDLTRLGKEHVESRDEATRRRQQLDELALERDRLLEQQQAQLATAVETHETKVAELEQSLQETRDQLARTCEAKDAGAVELTAMKGQLDELNIAVAEAKQRSGDVEAEKSRLEQKQTDLKEDYATFKDGCRKFVILLRHIQEERIAQASSQAADLRLQLEQAEERLLSLQAETKSTTQRASRDATLIKELRKELAREKKRSVKIESELSTRATSAVSSLSASPKPVRKGHQRTPSASSVRSHATTASVESFGGQQQSAPALDDVITASEQSSLLARMTEMQTSKAELEDQVRRLKKNIKELQTELDKKNLVLDAVVHTGNTPVATSKSPARPNNKATIQSLQQANAKLKTLMEETLMKNIQLETLVEELTKDASKES